MGDGILSPAQDITLPYESSEFSDWTTAFDVPFDCFFFPHRGTREIEFGLVVRDKKDNALAYASEKTTVQVNEIGYIDYVNLWEKTEKIALKIVHVIVSNNSGYFTLDTTRVVNEWIKQRTELRSEDSEKSKIKQSLSAAFSKIKNSTLTAPVSSVVSLVRELSDNVRTADKYAFMEFFLSVVAKFENISTDDFKLLDLISKEMGLDDKEYQEAKHKYLPMHEVEESDPFVVLGIPNTLSVQEKKSKLRELFHKWNALAIHKDPEMRKKAEKMINTIAECQKKLSPH